MSNLYEVSQLRRAGPVTRRSLTEYLRLRVRRRPADPDEDVRALMTLDEPTRSLLARSPLSLDTEVVALTIEDRERILWALDDVRTDAVAALRWLLLSEHDWRRRDGLS